MRMFMAQRLTAHNEHWNYVGITKIFYRVQLFLDAAQYPIKKTRQPTVSMRRAICVQTGKDKARTNKGSELFRTF